MKELIFKNKEAAFKVAELLLEESYILMISKEEQFTVISYEWSEDGDRRSMIFMTETEAWDTGLIGQEREVE